MTAEEVFQAWAPEESPWSAWAKPVLFAHLEPVLQAQDRIAAEELPVSPRWTPPADGSYAVVIDLPGAQGLIAGAALAKAGFRPVPLYNAVPTPTPMFPDLLKGKARVAVDVSTLLDGLAHFAPALARANVRADAPPAFLLDARRRTGEIRGKPGPGDFDNRSISLPTDFPSATRLAAAGIGRVLVIMNGSEVENDLAHTLRRWQDGGIEMFHCAPESTSAVAMTIRKPPWYRSLWHGLMARSGLRAAPLGGFGGFIPEPSSSGGGIG